MMWIMMTAECQVDFHFVDQLQNLPPSWYQALGRTCILSIRQSVDSLCRDGADWAGHVYSLSDSR